MKLKAVVTSSDGKTVDLHFGRCSDFRIIEVDGATGEWRVTEERKTEQTCHHFAHQEEHVKEVVSLLSDCSFLLTYRIGIYPYSLFRSRGILCMETPTEEPQTIGAAVTGLCRYIAECRASSDTRPVPAAEAENTERKGISLG